MFLVKVVKTTKVRLLCDKFYWALDKYNESASTKMLAGQFSIILRYNDYYM